MSLSKSTQAVSILLACYPQSKADDAFGQMAAHALENFGERTLTMLVDPKGGIITSSKYLPSIAEMVQWCKDFQYNSVPSRPNYVRFEEPEPVDEESKRRVDAILASLNFGRGVDKFQAYIKQMKPGERMSVQDPKYIEFCNNYPPTDKPLKKPVVTDDELKTIMSSFKDPPKLSEEALQITKSKIRYPYKDD